MSNGYPELPPSGIGESAKYNFSPWYIKLRFEDNSVLEGRRWKEATKPLSSLQAKIGNEFEDKIYDELEDLTSKKVNQWYDWGSGKNEQQLIDNVREVYEMDSSKRPVMLTQVRLSGEIKSFNISGDADLVLLIPTDEGVHIHVFDIKASWDEKPHQQLQTATYSLLTRQAIQDVDFDYSIGAGIIYRDTDINDIIDKDNIPSFHLETREGDVKRILKEDGPFTRAFDNDLDDLPLYPDRTSPYSEVMTVKSVENGDLSLLDLTPGEQKKLKDEGIEKISDVAELYDKVTDSKPYEYDDIDVNPEHRETVDKLNETSALFTRLSILSQKAQAYLGDIDPEHEYAHDKPWLPWIQASGDGNLPDDNPNYDADLPYRENSLIRVYMNVQFDHIQDALVSVSGRVDCGLYDREPLTFSRVVENINREPSTWKGEYEYNMLQSVCSDIIKSIKLLAQISGATPKAPIHFYMYTQREYEAFYDSLIRHENIDESIKCIRQLFDSRDGIDQPMVSIVKEEIENRMATKQPDLSITSIYNRFYPDEDKSEFTRDEWEVQTDDGVVNFRDAFREQMFDTYVPIRYDDGKAEVLTKHGQSKDNDDYYPIVPRDGSQIPIEYLWSSKEIDILDKNWSDDDKQKGIIESFRWVDSDKKDRRISKDDYGIMSSKLAHILQHIERGIKYKNTNIDKTPLSINGIDKIEETGTLADSFKDYLDIEAKSQENEAFEVYKKPLSRRVTEGESVPLRVTDILEDEGYMFKVKGDLLFEDMGFENPKRIAGSSKVSGGDGTTGGSRMVATPIMPGKHGFDIGANSPEQIATSVKVSVEKYDPDNSEIVIKGYMMSSKLDYEYVRPRKPWTLTPGERVKQYVGPGEMFVLDPNPDNRMAEKALKVIRNADKNRLYNDIKMMKNKKIDIEESSFKKDNLEEYLDWSEDALEFSPNKKQSKFIEKNEKYSLLQGPPGTGKTSGAICHSIWSRVYDYEKQNKVLTGVVTGLSNKSVDEVLEDVSELKSTFDDYYGNHPLQDTRLVRLSYGAPEDASENVEYLNYQKEADIEILRGLLDENSKQSTLSSSVNNNYEHTIIFTTPGRVEGLMGKIDEDLDAEEMYENPSEIFDLLVIDEASMMPIHQSLLVGAFMKRNGQALLAGDHRQLPPVQQHDWGDERRESIVKHLPHLSILDYLRYLRGDDIEAVFDDSPESPKIDIPMVRLNRTYRCHQDVTEFLRKTVYEKDDIDYKSGVDETMPEIDSSRTPINEVFRQDSPLTVLIHDDRNSQQVNEVEAQILGELTSKIPDSESVGIVTPHNAQKGRLNVICGDSDVDTVERFQGGEKDIMFLSATVSDPAFLSKEEDFILSENRLNVALSRMKKKLVVIIPMSILEIVPQESETYERARIWKSLYSEVNADELPDWEGKVSDINKDSEIESVNVEIHNLSDS